MIPVLPSLEIKYLKFFLINLNKHIVRILKNREMGVSEHMPIIPPPEDNRWWHLHVFLPVLFL